MNDSRIAPPIFIVGVPRSGTTLLAAMLGAHPRLLCGPETFFFTYPSISQASLCHEVDWPQPAVDFLYSLEHVGKSVPSNYGLSREEITAELAQRRPSIASILSGLIELYMRPHGKSRWIEKTPDHLIFVDRIRKHYPESPIIRILRDPRDVATSLLRVDWGPGSLIRALDIWRNRDELSAGFFERDARSYTLRYEDLVRDPEPVLRELCRVIDEPFDPAMLDTSRSARLVNATAEACKTKVANSVDPSRAEAWRREFSEEELKLVEAVLGDRLRAYGYPVLDFESPHPVEVRNIGLLDQYPDLAAGLLARGARFWSHPGERPELALFVDDPNEWISYRQPDRLRDTVQIARTIMRHRLTGVPIEWVHPTGRVPGRCAQALSLLLPRPQAGSRVPEFVRLNGPVVPIGGR